MIRTKPLRPRSASLCASKRAQRREYGKADAEADPWCVACGSTQGLQHSHLYTQGRFKGLRNNPLNWVLKCPACHSLFEHNKPAFAAQYPEAWADILRRMETLDAAAFAEFQLKHAA